MSDIQILRERPGDAQWAVDRWAQTVVRKEAAAIHHSSLPPIDKDLLRDELNWVGRRVVEVSHLRIAVRGQTVVGCAILGEDTVHLVYVCKCERLKGIGTRLLEDVVRTPWFFSTETKEGWAFVKAIAKHGRHAGRFDQFKIHRALATGSTVSTQEVHRGIPAVQSDQAAAAH